MKNRLYRIILLFAAFGSVADLSAQVKEVAEMWNKQLDTVKVDFKKPMYLTVSKDQALELFSSQPDFGLYKDNYFITGIPTNIPANNQTADAKFQISIRQRLFNTIMPFNTQLMLIYTQKSFWNIYEESCPVADNNYNPGLLLTRPIIHKNSFKGMLALSFEHESNGRKGAENRSWNFFTFSGTYFFNSYFFAQAKIWYGWLGEDNTELYECRGFGLLALNYRGANNLVAVSFVLNPIKDFSVNTQLEVSYKINKRANQFLFLQWYNGRGENLLNYNRHTSMVRAGICIKSPLRNLY